MREHKFSGAQGARTFILAGRAIFTLRSTQTGTRFTYRVTHDERMNLWHVEVLSGPENASSYRRIGFIDGLCGRGVGAFKITPSRGYVRVMDGTGRTLARIGDAEESKSRQAFDWLWNKSESFRAGTLPATVEVWHAGRCGACGRMLTVPESIESGIGPVCAEKGAA